MSMYRQLWLAVIVSMLVALAGSLLASSLSARSYLAEQLSMKNTDNAATLALSLSLKSPDMVETELAVSALFDSGHYELIRVVDPRGSILVERRMAPGSYGAPAWFVRLLPIEARPGQAQISSGWKQVGTVQLVSNSRFAYESLWQSVWELAAALFLATLVGGYLGTLILRRLRAPLLAVIGQARAITERRFVTIEEPDVPELKQLAAAMNATVGRLQGMFEEEAARLDAVRREANCDSLTGLANRSHFLARLHQALEAEDSRGIGLILVRVADLAGVNRRLGRDAGDGAAGGQSGGAPERGGFRVARDGTVGRRAAGRAPAAAPGSGGRALRRGGPGRACRIGCLPARRGDERRAVPGGCGAGGGGSRWRQRHPGIRPRSRGGCTEERRGMVEVDPPCTRPALGPADFIPRRRFQPAPDPP